MATRTYNIETRRRQQEALKARIAAAAAELHAEQGALATSHAQIAQRAGVSLPTVYKHFPTLDELIPACTGLVAAQAPRFPQERILEAADIATAAERLVEACDALHAHFEPWMAWREHPRIESLAEMVAAQRRQMLAFCESVLAHHGFASAARGETAAVWETLLHFDTWHRLVRDHRLSRAATRKRQHQLLLAALGPQPAASSTPSPRRK